MIMLAMIMIMLALIMIMLALIMIMLALIMITLALITDTQELKLKKNCRLCISWGERGHGHHFHCSYCKNACLLTFT